MFCVYICVYLSLSLSLYIYIYIYIYMYASTAAGARGGRALAPRQPDASGRPADADQGPCRGKQA